MVVLITINTAILVITGALFVATSRKSGVALVEAHTRATARGLLFLNFGAMSAPKIAAVKMMGKCFVCFLF